MSLNAVLVSYTDDTLSGEEAGQLRYSRTFIAGFAAAIAVATTGSAMAQSRADTVIRNVTVIDPAEGTTRKAADVFIADGRIVEVTDAGLSTRTTASEVPGEGRFVIPGLMDMHAHSSFRPVHTSTLLLMLANGVTGIREMGSDCIDPQGIAMCIDEMREVQVAIATGETRGPRILALSTAKIDSNRPDRANEVVAAYRPVNADDAKATIAFMIAREPDILKIGDQFMPAPFAALAEAAHEAGMRFGGHIPPYLSVANAARLGMTSIEHARDLPLDCSTYGASFRAAVRAAMIGESEEWPDRLAMPALAHDTFDEATCDGQIDAMLENGTFYVPTHLTREMDYRAGDAAYRDDPRLVYIIGFQQQGWFEDMDRTVDRMGHIHEDLARFFQLGLRTTAMAHAAGVPVMAGTDANDTMVFPGFSLHDELRHLVTAGLSPMDALRAATSVPARYLGRSDELGGVGTGMLADLVILDANPLEDIGNTARIAGVFLGGTFHDRAELDGMLAEVRAWVTETDAHMEAATGQ